jgi:lipoic acid synthetase
LFFWVELRAVNVDVVTFGQYMRPTKRHMPVAEYVRPAVFETWRRRALDMGFLYCASGPLVRSSYKAGEAFIENVLLKRRAAASSSAIAASAVPLTTASPLVAPATAATVVDMVALAGGCR